MDLGKGSLHLGTQALYYVLQVQLRLTVLFGNLIESLLHHDSSMSNPLAETFTDPLELLDRNQLMAKGSVHLPPSYGFLGIISKNDSGHQNVLIKAKVVQAVRAEPYLTLFSLLTVPVTASAPLWPINEKAVSFFPLDKVGIGKILES